MAIKTIFAETTLEGFSLSEIYGYFFKSVSPAPFSLAVGETYTVVWGPDTFEVTAQDSSAIIPGTTFIGNGANYGFPSNDEPFAIVCSASDVTFFAVTDTEPNDHTIAIYHGTEDDTGADPEDPPAVEPEEPPEGIVLKDRNGNDVAYYGIETVTFDTTTEGKQQTFTKGVAAPTREIAVNFADGDMHITADKGTLIKDLILKKPDDLDPGNIRAGKIVAGVDGKFIGDTEEVVVGESEGALPLNFAEGNMEITPSAANKVISKVIIESPETLKPENIAEGVDIAGIIGTFAGGAKLTHGSFKATASNQTISHNLGVYPDVLVVFTKESVSSGQTLGIIHMRSWIYNALGSGAGGVYFKGGVSAPTTTNGNGVWYDTTTFYPYSTSPYVVGKTYYWIAIGGLTE